MATVDPYDDSICRWVVWHYRYDHDRHERRNVIVAAFDNAREFHAEIERAAGRLRAAKDRGDAEPVETISGQMHEPGYRHRQRNGHLLRRAIEHGVGAAGIDHLELPADIASIRSSRPT